MMLLLWIVGLAWAGGEAELNAANSLYEEGRYAEAAEGYAELVESGRESGDLYYNLGNALFRDGRIGHAVLAWETALVLRPRDGDAAANIVQAHSLGDAGDSKISRDGPLLLNGTLSEKEQATLAAGLFFLLGTVVLLARRRGGTWGIPSLILGIPATYLLVSVVLSHHQNPMGIVLEADAPLRSALGVDRGVVLRTLHWGSPVRILETAGDYTLVELSNGESGWLGNRDVGAIDSAGEFPL